jgi:hypothetical protein
MTDLERRLRAALHAAVEEPPPGLMEAVLRRHRRHRVRLGASLVAVLTAAAVAAPPVAGALRGGGVHGPAMTPAGHHLRAPGPAHRHVTAAAGTVLDGCHGSPNAGNIGRVGRLPGPAALPLHFLDGGHSSGPLRLYVAIAVLTELRPGSVAIVRVPAAYRRDLRFLYGPGDSLNPGTRYTMRSGEAGVTFEACRAAQQIVRSGTITDYYGGYLVRGARCVPVRVWVPGREHPVTIKLGACAGR